MPLHKKNYLEKMLPSSRVTILYDATRQEHEASASTTFVDSWNFRHKRIRQLLQLMRPVWQLPDWSASFQKMPNDKKISIQWDLNNRHSNNSSVSIQPWWLGSLGRYSRIQLKSMFWRSVVWIPLGMVYQSFKSHTSYCRIPGSKRYAELLTTQTIKWSCGFLK